MRPAAWASAAAALFAAAPALAADANPPAPAPADPKAAAAAEASQTIISRVAKGGFFDFDYGVPSSPALSLAGLSGDNIPVSASLKPFVLSLPAVFNGGGGQSAALDMAPAWVLIRPEDQSYDAYAASRAVQWMYRTRVGVALYNGDAAGGDPKTAKPSRLAAGVTLSVLSSSDPLLSPAPGSKTSAWLTCLARLPGIDTYRNATYADQGLIAKLGVLETDVQVALTRLNPPPGSPIKQGIPANALADRLNAQFGGSVSWDGKSIDEIGQALSQSLIAIHAAQAKAQADANGAITDLAQKANIETGAQDCIKQASQVAQSSADLSFGGGAVMRGKPGALSDFSPPAGVFWVSFHYPFSRQFDPNTHKLLGYWAIGFSGRLSWHEFVTTGDATTPEIRADVRDAWMGLERVTPTSKLSVQWGYLDVSANLAAQSAFSKRGDRFRVAASLPIGGADSGMWLGLAYSDSRGTVSTLRDHAYMVTLDFAPPKADNIFNFGK